MKPDHLLLDEDGTSLLVVDRDRVPNHLREDRGRARPGPIICFDPDRFISSIRRMSRSWMYAFFELRLNASSFPRRRP